MSSTNQQTVVYPTDPLTAIEIDAISEVIKNNSELSPIFHPTDVSKTAVFLEILLKEPKKKYVVAFEKNHSLPLNRKAVAIVYNNVNNNTFEVTLQLREPGINVGPIAMIIKVHLVKKYMYQGNNFDNYPIDDDFGGNQYYHYFPRSELIELVRSDRKLMKILAEYNIFDYMLDPANEDQPYYIFPYAFYTFESFRQLSCVDIHADDIIPANAENHRYMPAGFFNPKKIPGDIIVETSNWGFVDGIFIIVDTNAKEIFRIVEDPSKKPKNRCVPPIANAVPDPYPVIYHPPMKPLATTMPEGPSFIVDDNDIHKVKWDNWEFHWSYQKSGLNLYNIYYTETVIKPASSEKRKILYKFNSPDTLVVYNSSEPLIQRNYVSGDSFSWPILQRLQTLVPGRDVPGYAKLYPVVTMDAGGNSRVIEGAVAIYEQEHDLAWRVNQGVIDVLGWPNYEFNEQFGDFKQLTGARQRELVIRTLFSGFYYIFAYSYVFRQDGSIHAYCDLMGQTTNQWIAYNPCGHLENHEYRGGLVSKQMVGLNHTHSVVYRMDFDIHHDNPSGGGNSVLEHNSYTVECRDINPAGQVIENTHTLLKTEGKASRDQNIQTNRSWSVINPNSLNRLRQPRGYDIWSSGPNGNSVSLARDDSQAHLHYGYLKHHLHVTRYHNNEQYAVGEYPVLSNEVTGIEKYKRDDESIVNEDIVVWFNRMFSHTPSAEDYPFISSHRIGVELVPENFFGMNPAASLEQKTTILPDGDIGQPTLFPYVQ